MATLKSIANGNFDASSTWGVVDTTSLNTAYDIPAILLPTTTPTDRGTWVDTGITINGYGLKPYRFYSTATMNPAGTFTAVIRNVTDGVDVANTSVTVDVKDFKCYEEQTTGNRVTWTWFPTNGNVTLTAGKTYAIRISASANNLIYFTGSTTTVLLRMLSTTTTQAPANGDTLVIAGYKTGAGTNSSITVTMNETSTTNYYGTRSNVGIIIGSHGVLTYGSSASTNYYLKVRGELQLGTQGTLNIGTSVNPIPTTSTAVLEFDCAAIYDSGLFADPEAVINVYGSALYANGNRTRLASNIGGSCTTVGTAVTRVTGQVYTGLTGNVGIRSGNGAETIYTIASVSNDNALTLTGSAGNRTEALFRPVNVKSIETTTSTGWLSGDPIGIFKGSRSNSDSGMYTTLTADAIGTTLAINDEIDFAKDTAGDSDWAVEIMNLKRNVKIRGISTSLTAFIIARPGTHNIQHAEFTFFGQTSTTAPTAKHVVFFPYGVQFSCADTYTSNINYVSAYNFGPSSVYNYFLNYNTNNSGANWNYIDAFSISLYLSRDGTVNLPNYSTHHWVTGLNSALYIRHSSDQVSDIRASTKVNDLGWNDANEHSGGFVKDCYFRNYATHGLTVRTTQVRNYLLDNVKVSRAYGYGFDIQTTKSNLTMIDCEDIGSWSGGIVYGNNITYNNTKLIRFNHTATAGNTTTYGISLGGVFIGDSYFSSCTWASVIANTGTGISIPDGNTNANLIDCKVVNGTIFNTVTGLKYGNILAWLNYQQTSGDHRVFLSEGTYQTLATDYRTTAPCLKVTPATLNAKTNTPVGFVPAKAGTNVTVSVYVQTSTAPAYNGNRARLMVKENALAGITADTVLDTATASSDGAYELLSGTISSISEDCVLEIYVDCDGTTGYILVDDFNASPVQDTRGFNYWEKSKPFVVPKGGGGSYVF